MASFLCIFSVEIRKATFTGLPWWLRWYRDCLPYRGLGFDSWVRKIPWRRKWQPTQVFLPGQSHGQRSLVGYIPRGRKELDMTEQLTHIHSKFIWFGNVLLLMERSLGQKSRYFGKLGRREQGDGAWWAAGGVCHSKPAHSPPKQREKGRISFCNYSLGLTSDLMHSGVQDISWWISDIKLP